jgi:ABC-type bacteriocin/lantibiotic exporter with double-glycine peptidase domain
VRKAEVFDGTVLDNIRMGNPQVTLEEVRDTLRNVGLLEDVSGLPEGLMTPLSGTAGPLSAGQAQKLMLARVLVSKPKLILLDEALEHIDEESKDRLLRTLLDPDAPWTVLIASHESKDLSRASRIISLERGQVVGDVSSPRSS